MTDQTRRWSVFGWALGLLTMLSVAGCQLPQQETPPISFDLEGFAVRQDARASLLRLLESGGTIEIRQRDETGGEQFEDCALELWRDGDRFALRLRKLGERFLWVGSDGDQWWVFELTADPVRLVILPSGASGQRALGTEVLLFGPDQLLLLAGLQPISLEDAEVAWSEDGKVLRIETVAPEGGGWARIAWSIDPGTLLPVRMEAIDADGALVLESTLSGYEPIRARDQPVGNWPQFPRKLRVETPDGAIDVRLYFNRPGATGSKLREALFDLDQLMKTFKPGLIEYVKR